MPASVLGNRTLGAARQVSLGPCYGDGEACASLVIAGAGILTEPAVTRGDWSIRVWPSPARSHTHRKFTQHKRRVRQRGRIWNAGVVTALRYVWAPGARCFVLPAPAGHRNAPHRRSFSTWGSPAVCAHGRISASPIHCAADAFYKAKWNFLPGDRSRFRSEGP